MLYYFDDLEKLATYPELSNVTKISVQEIYLYFDYQSPQYLDDLVYGFKKVG